MVEAIIIEKKIKEIGECLSNLKYDSNNIGLMGGISGQILFEYHLYIKLNENIDNLIFSIESLYSLISEANIGLTYSYGMSGVFDVLNYLKVKDFIDDGYQDSEFTLNNFFKEKILYDIENNNLDFLHGSSGILNYLINTTNNENHTDFFLLNLNLYVEKITKKDNELISFPSYNYTTNKSKNDINLGLSHGNPAIICLLIKLFQKTNNLKIEPLIQNLFNTFKIIKNKKNNRVRSIYPYSNNDLNESRLAWCYGDLGVASTFWQAGKVFNNQEWKQAALDIMLHASTRLNLEENMVVDAGICHGSAGVAHIFNRFYKETNIKEFDIARWYWLKQTINMATFEDGLAGYKAWFSKNGWQNESGFLEGISGIGLVLLGFLSNDIEDLDWDRVLLLS